jgi:hypothetical protein
MYAKVQVKEDQGVKEVYYYLCITKGCGAVINPEFPKSLVEPSPKHCKDCKTAEVRNQIETEWRTRSSKVA